MLEILDKINKIYNKKHILNSLTKKNSCIDLYQFLLTNYPMDHPIKHPDEEDAKCTTIEFDQIKNTNHEECGSIKLGEVGANFDYWNNEYKHFQNLPSSCDIINNSFYNNMAGGFTFEEYNKYYTDFLAKGDKEYTVYTYKELKIFLTVFWKISSKMKNKQILNIFNINIFSKLNHNIKQIPDDLIKMNDSAIIYRIKIANKIKIIIFGDFHGSYHTFFRHMLRLHRTNILNINTFKINEGYMLIFLGDILDRGIWSFEIITFILQLINTNNDYINNIFKIILIRGNHEELHSNFNYDDYSNVENDDPSYSFLYELSFKFEENFKRAYLYTHACLSIFPSAIILEIDNGQKFWLSNGGFPKTNIDKNIKKKTKKEINNDYEKNAIPLILDDTDIQFFEKTNEDYPMQIRWNDFCYNKEDELAIYNTQRMYTLYPKIITQFLEMNKIDFIIRGHQDDKYNSYILVNDYNIDEYCGYDINEIVIDDINNGQVTMRKNDIIYKNNNYKDGGKKVNGPIGRIATNFSKSGEQIKCPIRNEPDVTTIVYPVLTLSTNTDYDRFLNYDSFGILRFDLKHSEFNNFDKNNIIDINNKMNPIPIPDDKSK